MVITLLILLLAAAAVMWLQAPPKPQPVRVQRNPLQEELLARYMDQNESDRRW
jgi:hypothetical protein